MTGAGLTAAIDVRRRGFHLDVALDAAPGETVAVMGPSGAGKSTLLAVLAGLLRPDRGEVTVSGRVVTAGRRLRVPPARRGVVLLEQDPRLFPHLSARDNVAFGLRARGADRVHAQRDADDWLWRVGLPGVGEHRPAELSGGQQQRIALARALATAPRVLLLDEPLTSLDTATAADIRAVLAEQLAAVTAVVVTHDALDAVALARRLVVVERGAVTQQGPVREVLAAPGTSFVASAAGLNRVAGVVRDGVWRADGIALAVAGVADGTAAAVFPPGRVVAEPVAEPTWTAALRLAPDLAPGEWIGRVERLEPTPAGVRVRTSPAGVLVDLDLDRAAELHLIPGTPLRLRIAPDAVRCLPS